ncbi:cytosine/adenosine deaminase-related metal-dependent hydrolase [Paraburkholderia caballeronis]|nr:cytosine/adenosine deaminase-related metal-dependent hydrolase [Paraburkholderia caballeronis]
MSDYSVGPAPTSSARANDGAVSRTVIRNARILTMDPARPEWAEADVVIEGDTIRAVGPGASAGTDGPCKVIDGAGHLVMPGLINAHFHSPTNFLKGALDSLPLELFMLYEVPGTPEAAVSARTAYVRTQLGAAEMLKVGITSVQDDAFFLPAPSRAEIDAVMSAYGDIGMRATVALDQPELPEIAKLPFLGELVPASLKARLTAPAPMPAEELLRHYAYLIDTWHGSADGRLRAAVSCSAPQRVSVEYLSALDDISRAHDLPLYIHMLETRLQRVFGEVCLNGRSLIRHVDECGLLSARMNVIHAVWIDDDDIARLANAGAQVIHNPISNLRLGSGVMPFRRLMDAGVPIALGSDEIIADDAVNMWSVMKTAALVHTIGDPDPDRWPVAREILGCMYAGGAQAMRQEDRVGRIAADFQADLIMLDLDTLPFTPLNDLARQLVYTDASRAVVMTMVAGRVVAEQGRLLTIDERALRQEAREIVAAHAAQRDALMRDASVWMPYYREMYRRALDVDVGMNRWIGDAKPARP